MSDLVISQGQRLRVRAYADDFEAAMGNAYTASLVYGGAANATGDSYILIPILFTEYVPYLGPNPWDNLGLPIL